MFESVEPAPPDPILGLTEAFKEDPSPGKINLGTGIYADDTGKTPTLECIKAAEKVVSETATSGGGYLPMTGLAEYDRGVVALLFGEESEIPASGRALAAQTPGGTGGLRVAADFIARIKPGARIWMSDPTWANHNGIFTAAGLELATYPYYNHETKALNFDEMVATLKEVPAGDVVLFHACCHNPSGMDPNAEQWNQLADLAAERGFLPLFDFAYQGFGTGIEEDAFGLRAFAEKGMELLVASSFSKNFGLYNQRAGAMTVVARTAEAATVAMSHVKLAIRVNYSNPPAHGARLVAAVLADSDLRRVWEQDVTTMRNRINGVRQQFVETMATKTDKADFSFVATQCGMFSFSGLNKEQVLELREKHSIYIVGSGRISIAGITSANLDPLCSAIAAVL
ncbi:MAG: amino acid aminotransferase [Roseibacillus sp.]|jgi:aspartate/tyrosine/aromatic aminotransferase|nr:aromatic amino acid aminotransferase [Roseibacillus sp.]MCP4728781.1 aspartate/tyrosine/aromatic aminotransferase [Roseibacillus sp.]MDP7307208.1 amino acid aminotransferase [Roseibacillus sp.]HJM63852.1 amino acid aminotransferase [Roseibacillus sp.]|tara:strand:- start:3772 stop:4965 length:1194 start_codon:yes stop_codon:yes gene_type:complete